MAPEQATGQTWVNLRVFGPQGSAEVRALADTGATFTKVPHQAAEEAGLQTEYEVPAEMADGRTIKRSLDLAELQIEGMRRPVLVSVAENGQTALVGYTTLETVGFKVNPVTHRLELAPAIEY